MARQKTIDALFADVIAQYHNGGRPVSKSVKVKPDDGLDREKRWRRKVSVGDYSDNHLKKVIEAKLDLHHVPYAMWKYQYTQEVVEKLFGTDYDDNFLYRAGRALSQIAREYPGVQRKIHCGRTHYLVP